MSFSFSRLNKPGSPASTGWTRSGRRCGGHLFFLARADEFAEPAPSPVQPRTHGADGNVEGGRDLVVGHALPREEQQGVALTLRERGDRGGDVGPGPRGVEASVGLGEAGRTR